MGLRTPCFRGCEGRGEEIEKGEVSDGVERISGAWRRRFG